MSKAAAEKVLAKAEKIMSDRWARKDMQQHRQYVTLTAPDLAQSMYDGYQYAMQKRAPGTYPQISMAEFKKEAPKHIPILYNKWAGGANKKITVVKRGYNGKFLRVIMKKEEEDFYDAVKQLGVNFINKHLGKTGDKLGGAQKEWDRKNELGIGSAEGFKSEKQKAKGEQIWRSTSEEGRFKTGYHKTHSEQTTVGGARLIAAADLLAKSSYSAFLDSNEFKTLKARYPDFRTYFGTSGMKGTNASAAKVTLQKDEYIYSTIGPRSKNFSGSEQSDWSGTNGIGAKLQKALKDWADTVDWTKTKGSPSTREHARALAKTTVLAKLVNNKAVNKGKSAKVKAVPDVKKQKASGKKGGGKFPKAKSVARGAGKPYPKAKTGGTSRQGPGLYTVMALINDKLPETVEGNMGAPRLESQTGRFAASVRITDVVQTPQGMPSFGYTYEKSPYSVFESSSGSRFASGARDPRSLIDASIREIAAGYALGRFYTRRQ